MRALLAAVALACTINAGTARAEIYSGKIVGQQMSQDWASMMVSHGSDVRIRATTVNSEHAGIYVDFLVPSCALLLELSFPFSSPSNTDIASVQIPVALRVDTNDIIRLQGLINPVAMGDASYIVTLPKIDDFDAFANQMRAGQVLRVKEGFQGDQQYYYVFSLRGFSEAFDRAQAACGRVARAFTAPPSAPQRPSPPPPSSDPSKWF